MKTIFNFGDVHKDLTLIANTILREYDTSYVPITNNKIFYNSELQIVSPSYGPSMVLDSLVMLKESDRIKQKDNLIFLGSMGSFSQNIRLGDLVIPTRLYCECLKEYQGKEVSPDKKLLEAVKEQLRKSKTKYREYIHGSVFAVFDPTTNHEKYTNSMYGDKVLGVDCSESFIGLKFSSDNGVQGLVLLYCSDDPITKITNVPKEDFDKRAFEKDLKLHQIAYETLKSVI